MIVGAHAILYSRKPEADRAFLKDVLKFPNVDVGGGWLIFGLPPAEVAVHPSEKNDVHEFYLMCDDVQAFVAEMDRKAISCSEVQSMGWGLLTHVRLPGGGKLGVYQARHARPRPIPAQDAARRPVRRTAKATGKARGPEPSRRPRRGRRTDAKRRAAR